MHSKYIFDKLKIAEVISFQCDVFNCSVDRAWDKYTHPIIKEHITLEEMKQFINTLKI